jgi:hypothetical protein
MYEGLQKINTYKNNIQDRDGLSLTESVLRID